MKGQLRIVAIAILSNAVACNYTDGKCYPVGQGHGNVDVGGGVIDSTGSGAAGDAPMGQAQSALSSSACNATEQSSPGGSGGPEMSNPALDVLASANPAQVAAALLQAEDMAYLTAGAVSQGTGGPSQFSGEASDYAPAAAADAQQWVAGLSPDAIPLFTPDPGVQDKCMQDFGCGWQVKCPGIGVCSLAGCGSGKCPTCPDIANINSSVVSGWCAHVCVGSDGTGAVVGYAAVIHFRGGVNWKFCQAVANKN